MPFPTQQQGGLHFVDHGGAGHPILLVHGLGGSHLNWDLVAPGLTRLGRVVAVDLPGFGTNEPDGHRPHIRAYADLISNFIDDHFGQPTTVIGNSMGGLVSIIAAARHPRHVRNLVLVSPALPPRALRFYWPTVQLLLRTAPGVGEAITKKAYDRYTMEELTDLAFENICADASVVPDHLWERSLTMAKWRQHKPWAIRAFSVASASILREISRPIRFRKYLSAIEARTLLIHGDSDRIVQPAAAIWAAGVRPDWRFVMLPGVGHVPMIERPERFLDLVTEFMAPSGTLAAQSPSA